MTAKPFDPITLYHDTKFVLTKKLGEGTSGTVYSAQSRNVPSSDPNATAVNFAQRAIKVFAAKSINYYWRERNALERLRDCCNVVQMERSVTGLDFCYIIMEECDGDLYQVVAGDKSVSEPCARLFFSQMARGLVSAHSKEVCHHDVKLDNFLVGKDGEVRLSDFGYALLLDDKRWAEQTQGYTFIKGKYSAGSPAYSSPQVLNKLPHNPILSDIYGLGVCLYRLVCGRFPFCDPENDSHATLRRNVDLSKDPSRISFPPHVSQELKELVCGMIAYEEADRWDGDRIIYSQWFSDSE
eukprot:TRINITY_DN2350_c0_g1_i3.p1 TRINITY_DN2350_c0_g1~~TRINITY_DN2350_c0_g1_i3.p1  ORF type:complete len:331 (-),score=99.16 TRINITY_DN2350_c0_g1_i3:55-945(-)